jgi:hypothetical protein
MKFNFYPQPQYFPTDNTGAPSPEDVKNAKNLLDTVTALQDAFQSISVIIGQQINKNLENTDEFTKRYAKTLKNDIVKNLNSMGKNNEDLIKNQELLNKGQSKSKDIQQQINSLDLKRKLLLKDLDIIQSNGLLTDEEKIKYTNEILAKISEQNEELIGQLSLAKDIEGKFGAIGAVVEGTSKFLQKWGIDSGVAARMTEKLQAAAAKGQIGFKELSKVVKEELTAALQDPLVKFAIGLKLAKSGFNDIKKAFDIFKEFNAIFVNTARNIGMSVDQVKKMGTEAAFTKNTIEGTKGAVLDNIYSQKQLQQAISDVNTQLGLSVDLGGSTIDEFTAMTNQMGLSAEEATKIYKLGLLSNTNLKDTNKSIADGIVAAQKSTGIQVNAKQVFQEIGKLSAGITAKFQQNPKALAEAVIQAKKLGTNLETVDKIGESLLNWESSIENELKAELLTGKQLNLERARAAALTGDQVTLMNEIASQVGSISDFQNMNVIAQKSLADAFGLSRDEMADMLQQQEVFNKLGDVSGKSAAEQLAIAKERGLTEEDSLVVNLKQQAAAEKLEAVFDAFKLTLVELISGPFGGLVDMMTSLAKHATLVKVAMGVIATVSLAKTLGGLAIMATQMGLASASSMAWAAGITLGLGVIAITAALVSMSSATSDAQNKATANIPKYAEGGIVTEPHIGMVGEAGPEAIIPLNSSKAAGMLGGGGDLSPLITAMNEVRNAVNALANKPQPTMALHVGREKLGEVVGSTAETGTSQYKNAYSLA